MPITDMQPAEKVWGNFGCIRINCRTLWQLLLLSDTNLSFITISKWGQVKYPAYM